MNSTLHFFTIPEFCWSEKAASRMDWLKRRWFLIGLLVLIPAGLAILGLEFAWARYWLRKARRTISSQTAKVRGQRAEAQRGTRNGHD